MQAGEREFAQAARRVVGDKGERIQQGRRGGQGGRRPPAQRERADLERIPDVTGVDHDGGVDLAAAQPVDQLERAVDTQLHGPAGELLAHDAQQVRQDRVDEVLDHAEHERAGFTVAALQTRHRAVMGAEHVGELGGGALAERRQLDAAPAAREQRLAELLLEAPDVPAHGRLREVQGVGGAVVAAEADDREKGAEVGGIEIHVPHGRAPERCTQGIDHGSVSITHRCD